MSFTSCDWGTTHLRIRVVRDGICEREMVTAQGASTLRSPLEFQAALVDAMHQLEAPWPVIISGMASSGIGWKHLPYAGLPFRIDGRDAIADEIMPEVFLISGVRAMNDVMRGEEMELIGLAEEWTDGIVILPGTHSKHCVLQGGALVDFRTFMTGELYALLGSQSILKDSVAPGWDEGAFVQGIELGSREPLTASLFRVRCRKLLCGLNNESNGSFLSGILIGAELAALPPDVPVMLAAAGNLALPYGIAFQSLGLHARGPILNPEFASLLPVRGQMKIQQRLGIK
ncbi:MAG: 2-dehydro-3-deoxygalactonokinase [Terrimicrobiaceae bacterium]